MPRSPEFNRETALKAAIDVFMRQGWQNTEDEDLRRAMRISPAVMAEAFGDKRDIFIESLRMYSLDNAAKFVRTLNSTLSPLTGLERALLDFAERISIDDGNCLGVLAMVEFGRADPGISGAFDPSRNLLKSALERTIVEGRKTGEISTDLGVESVLSFVSSTLIGMRTMRRAGATLPILQDVARLAVRSLR